MTEHVELTFLMEQYRLSESDCGIQVTDIHLEKLSNILGRKWRSLPAYLEMKSTVIDDIDYERLGCDESDKRLSFLNKWKEMRGTQATYRKLINALLEINCRNDAEKVCKLLLKPTPPCRVKPLQPVTSSSRGMRAKEPFI